jgi:group I intron endonuclease
MPRHTRAHSSFQCYKITCQINGKGYIGIASNGVAARWSQHKHDAYKGADTPLHAAIRKYGYEHFEIQTLAESSTWEEVCKLEIQLISAHNTLTSNNKGYNVATGGQGPYGVVRSEATRNKLKQYKISDARRASLRDAAKLQMADPKNREISREGANKMWRDPSLCEKSRRALEQYWNRDDAQLLRRENQRRVMSNATARNNLRVKAQLQMQNPANRQLSRLGAIKQWSNPEFVRSRIGANHPLAKPVLAEGVRYETIIEAARALGVTDSCIRGRIKSGKIGYAWAGASRKEAS